MLTVASPSNDVLELYPVQQVCGMWYCMYPRDCRDCVIAAAIFKRKLCQHNQG